MLLTVKEKWRKVCIVCYQLSEGIGMYVYVCMHTFTYIFEARRKKTKNQKQWLLLTIGVEQAGRDRIAVVF